MIRPDKPAVRLVLHDQDYWLNGFADRAAIKQLGTLLDYRIRRRLSRVQ
ncbi:MAG: hypothetical protein HOV87_32045 [Catenulispora sp.]|nr:hypothetical protein [Catenulispora sp.]